MQKMTGETEQSEPVSAGFHASPSLPQLGFGMLAWCNGQEQSSPEELPKDNNEYFTSIGEGRVVLR